MKTKIFSACIVLTLMIAVPGSALAKLPSPTGGGSSLAPFEFFVRVGAWWITDPRFDLVSETDAIPRVDLGFGYVPGWLQDRLTLEVGYSLSSTDAPLFDVMNAALALHSIEGAGTYTLLDHRVGRAFARAGASLIFASLSIHEDAGAQDASALEQTDLLLGLQGALGYELNLLLDPQGPLLGSRITLSAEVGYELVPFAANFDNLQRAGVKKTTPRRLEAGGIHVGEVDLSGWQLRFGGGLHF